MFASEWFSTLFSYNFDFDITARIWDIVLVDGLDYLFKVALALLQINQSKLLTLGFEDCVLFMKSTGYKVDPDRLVEVADAMQIEPIVQFWTTGKK